MTITKTMRRTTISALLVFMFAGGCSGEGTESLLASAKDYMAKNDNKAAVIQLKNALQKDQNLAEARFLLGKALLDSGNPTAAEVELRKADELKYSADQVTPVLARALLMLGQPEKITEDLTKVVLSSPESKADLQTTVGQAYLMQGKSDAAKRAFEAALDVQAGYAPALVGQARMKAVGRDLPGALVLLDSVLEKTPEAYEAWQLKGDLLSIQQDGQGALEAYRKVLEIKPDYLPAHTSLVLRLIESGKLDEAGTQFEAMKKIAPSHPQTSYLQAQLAYQQKNFKAAREAIQQHLKFVPNSTLGLQLAGAIEYQLGSYSTAETYLQSVVSNTPEQGLARRILIASYLRSGQPDKALTILQPLLDNIEENSDLLALAGEVFLQNGDADKAESYFAKAAALDPKNTGKRTSVAVSQLVQGDTQTAYQALEQIALTDPGIKADLVLIASQFKNRQFDNALKSISQLEKKQPDNPLVHNLRGSAYLGKGDMAAARKSFEQSLAKSPTYYPAAANLASMDLVAKKPEDARQRYERVIAKDPKNIKALLALAELRAKTGGTPDEIVSLINKAITAYPEEPKPRLALIQFYMSIKDTNKALSAAQDALVVLPEDPSILDAAGQAQIRAADFNQALATYGKLANLMPNSPQPYIRMAAIHVAAKNNEAAMQSLRKALAIKADSLEAQYGILLLDLNAGRVEEALATARQVQKQRPNAPVGFVLEGDVYAARTSWKEAAAAYRNGIKHSGTTAVAVKLYAVLVSAGGAAEADKFADEWIKQHATDFKFRLYLAEATAARKDFASASKHYRVLVNAQPNNSALLNDLAWTSAQNKDPKAIEYAEKAYKLAPDQAAINDTLGSLLVEKGDVARGMLLLQKAAGLAPQNPFIRFNLAKAQLKAGKTDEAKKALDALAKLGEKFPHHAEVIRLLKGL